MKTRSWLLIFLGGPTLLTFLLLIPLVWSPSLFNIITLPLFGIDVDPTKAPPGNIKAFDPVATFSDVQAFAGAGTELGRLRANHVRPDGTIDLRSNYDVKTHVAYTFIKTIDASSNTPVGAGVGLSGKQWQEIYVDVSAPGRIVNATILDETGRKSYVYRDRGMSRQEADPLGSRGFPAVDGPRCSFADLWKKAIAAGAPSNAVAAIRYDAYGYWFTIDGTAIDLTFDLNCELESSSS